MAQGSATRFAVIDQKLGEIQKSLDRFEQFMNEHAAEHQKIADKLSRQDVINGILIFLSGAIASSLIALFLGGFFS